VDGYKSIQVNIEEGLVFVRWITTGKNILKLTLSQYEALQDQKENIDAAFEADEHLANRNIGGSIYVGIGEFPGVGNIVNIREFYKREGHTDLYPTKTGIAMQRKTWYDVPWLEINKTISLIQETKFCVIQRCGKIIGRFVAKKTKTFCHQCMHKLVDETHECMYAEGSDYAAYQNKIKYKTGKIIADMSDAVIIDMIKDNVLAVHRKFMVDFIRTNAMLIGQYAQYIIEV
jgi:hypothetical protein